jgi:hypothetical protein
MRVKGSGGPRELVKLEKKMMRIGRKYESAGPLKQARLLKSADATLRRIELLRGK